MVITAKPTIPFIDKIVSDEEAHSGKLYKIVAVDGTPVSGGRTWFQYDLPTKNLFPGVGDEWREWIPGEWTRRVRRPSLCYKGYHLRPAKGVMLWLLGLPLRKDLVVYEAEGCGDCEWSKDNTKVVYASVRLLRPVADWRTFLCLAADLIEWTASQIHIKHLRRVVMERIVEVVGLARKYASGEKWELADASRRVELAGLLLDDLGHYTNPRIRAVIDGAVRLATSIDCRTVLVLTVTFRPLVARGYPYFDIHEWLRERVAEYVEGTASPLDTRVEVAYLKGPDYDLYRAQVTRDATVPEGTK